MADKSKKERVPDLLKNYGEFQIPTLRASLTQDIKLV